MRISLIHELHPTTRRLLLARGFRSVGQGALVVDFALYLRAMGWPGMEIGLLLSGVGLFGAALSIWVGTTSDRLRRKPFLLMYESIALLGSAAAVLTARPLILVPAAILSGFGRGANGAAGPFSPAEQAWLAEVVAPERRGEVYSLNTALGFFGMSIGAVFAMLPAFWTAELSGPLAYRPLFALVGIAAAADLYLLARAKEEYRGKPPRDSVNEPARLVVHRQENSILRRLMMVNGLNGLAIGLTGPLISYWFAIRYHVGPAEIAPMMAVTFLLTGGAALATGKLTQRIGIVRSVVWMRMTGVVLLVMLPLMPLFWLAAVVYLLRSAFNRGSAGARQALAMGLVRDERRGLAASLNAVSMQFPQSVGPTMAGWLLDLGQFSLPFFAGAALQALYVIAYGRIFRRYEPRPASE